MSSPSSPSPVDSTAVFRDGWAVYQKFLTHNWMRHREVYGAFREAAARCPNRPLSIADFGCGDACCTIAALASLPVQRFIAVDQVGPLLQCIPPQLTHRHCDVALLEGDLLTVAARPPTEPVDLVLTAYSVHHLSTTDKQTFFEHAGRWLKPDGRLVLIDLMCQPGENRRAYLDRFHDIAQREFSGFTEAERSLVREHMEGCDFPEEIAVWQQLLHDAGFSPPQLRYRDELALYGVLECQTVGTTT